MTTTNSAQHEAWNGESGTRWAATADRRDQVLAPVADVLLAAASPAPGARVIDIGCGCGATTLATAPLVGPAGSVVGFDLSVPMLEVARQRAGASGAANTSFVAADAQTHAFEPAAADLAMSRFGTMFFADPEAAFANIATALVPGGRLCMATWQPLLANEWLIVPGAVLLRHTELPPGADPGAPGMFAQSEPATIASVLGAAGFSEITTEACSVSFTLGSTVDDAVDYLTDGGPGRALLDTITDEARRDEAIAEVRAELANHVDGEGLRLGGAIYLTTAVRPPA